MFFNALISAIIVSLISLIGVVFIFLRKENMTNLLFILVALAAGTLIGDAFFHIIPEALEEIEIMIVFIIVIIGFLFFYLIETFMHWHHPHEHFEEHAKEHRRKKNISYLNLISDGFHNFLDGVLIAVSYIASFPIGVATTIAVIAHEIPQEIGDFGILLYSGMSKIKALMFNLLSALFAIVGVIVVYLGLFKESYIMYVLPLIAGGFLYISMSDLIPELHEHHKGVKSLIAFFFLILGLVLMFLLKMWLG
ncbi:MAG: ZIP family metal transporter [Nanoarchaeota archaeon]